MKCFSNKFIGLALSEVVGELLPLSVELLVTTALPLRDGVDVDGLAALLEVREQCVKDLGGGYNVILGVVPVRIFDVVLRGEVA